MTDYQEDLRELVEALRTLAVQYDPDLDEETRQDILDTLGAGGYGEPALPNEYRPDGFSYEVSEYGGRRFKDVDIVRTDLEVKADAGDAIAEKVLKDSYAWFAFNPNEFPELAPPDEARKSVIWEARNNNWGWMTMFARSAMITDFRLNALDPEPQNGKHFDYIDGHAYVFMKGNATDPSITAADYARQLELTYEELKAAAANDSDIIRPGEPGYN